MPGGPNGRDIRRSGSYTAVSQEPSLLRAFSILSLAETRRYVRESHARMMAAFFAILYALGSMTFGGMLVLAHVEGGYTTEVIWGNALGIGVWNYPGLLVVAPWGYLELPFLATWSMIFVSVGVGIGIAVAILISARLIRDRRRAGAASGTVGSVAGLTPAMIALVTLGACCSTTAAATAGVGLVARASGSTLNNLLVNNWYLDVFQLTVVFVALLAQELLLRVYGGLFGLASLGREVESPTTAPFGGRALAGGALRAGLLLAGVTWFLAVLAEWTTVSPVGASAALWYQWIVQHFFLASLAIAVALFPGPFSRAVLPKASSSALWTLRATALVGGLSLATWTPPLVALGGAPGLVNELFGLWGLSAAWGAVLPVYPWGIALAARWIAQYVLLGGFAVALALSPARALRPILWSASAAARSEPTEAPMPVRSPDARATGDLTVPADRTGHASAAPTASEP